MTSKPTKEGITVMAEERQLRSGLALSGDREYGGGYSDEQVAKLAEEDGRSSFHDSAVWGDNTELRVVHALHHALDVQTGLVEAAFAGDAAALEGELAEATPEARYAELRALDDVEEEEAAREEAERLKGEARRIGRALPRPGETLRYLGMLAVLVLGDLALIAVAFQVLGLSDRLLLGVVPFSSDLYLAASSSVLALLYLAHHTGADLVAIHCRRRVSAPQPGVLSTVTAHLRPATWALGALLILIGVASVRELYLAQRGTDAHTGVFFALQLGIFLAATAVSIAHAHPLDRNWKRMRERVGEASGRARESAADHAALVAKVGALLAERPALLALAVRHIRIAEGDTRRQIQLYLRATQLNQPEPVPERLFPAKLPARRDRSNKELEAALAGPGGIPEVDPPTVNAVARRREQMLERLRDLRRDGGRFVVRNGRMEREAPHDETAAGNGGGRL